jgi:hypothetical protein
MTLKQRLLLAIGEAEALRAECESLQTELAAKQ